MEGKIKVLYRRDNNSYGLHSFISSRVKDSLLPIAGKGKPARNYADYTFFSFRRRRKKMYGMKYCQKNLSGDLTSLHLSIRHQ